MLVRTTVLVLLVVVLQSGTALLGFYRTLSQLLAASFRQARADLNRVLHDSLWQCLHEQQDITLYANGICMFMKSVSRAAGKTLNPLKTRCRHQAGISVCSNSSGTCWLTNTLCLQVPLPSEWLLKPLRVYTRLTLWLAS